MTTDQLDRRGRGAGRAVRDEVSVWVDLERSRHDLSARVARASGPTRRRVIPAVAACVVLLVVAIATVAVFAVEGDDPIAVSGGKPVATTTRAYAFVPRELPEGFRPVARQSTYLVLDGQPDPAPDPWIVAYARSYGDVPNLRIRVIDADHSRPTSGTTSTQVRGYPAELFGFRDRFHHQHLSVRWVEAGRVVVVTGLGFSRERLLEIAKQVAPIDQAAFDASMSGVPIEPVGLAVALNSTFPGSPRFVADGEVLASGTVEGGQFDGGQFEIRLHTLTAIDGAEWTCVSSRTWLETGSGGGGDTCAEPAHGFSEPQLAGGENDSSYIFVSRDRSTVAVKVRLNDGRVVVATPHDTSEGARPVLFLADLGESPLRPGGTIVATNRAGKVLERWRFGPPK